MNFEDISQFIACVHDMSVFHIHDASFTWPLLLWHSLFTTFVPSQPVRWFSVVMWSVSMDLLMLFTPHVNCSLDAFATSFFCLFSLVLNNLPVSQYIGYDTTLTWILYNSSHCSSGSSLSFWVYHSTNRCLRVVWGCKGVASPYFFST